MSQDMQDATAVAPSPQPEPAAPQEGVVPDHVLEAQVAARRARREDREVEAGDRPVGDVLRAAQEDKKIAPEEIPGALDFFLATKDDAEFAQEPVPLKLNLGTKDAPQWVEWVIAPVEDSTITKLRKASVVGTRAQRRRGDAEVDEMLVSRKLVVAGTVDPDPKELAKTMGLMDPVDAVQGFFRRVGKTGLITQISGEILSISGWDDEDIQEVEAARG